VTRSELSPEHDLPPSPFPDKKVSIINHQEITQQLKEAQIYEARRSVSQEEATWLGFAEYDHIPRGLVFMTDVHYGNLGVDYELLERHLETIRNTPNMFVVFAGDMIDNFNPAKIPDGMLGDGVSPQDQAEAMMQIVTELDQQGKLVAITWGNHEDFSRVAGHDVFRTWFRELQAPIFADGGGVVNAMIEGVHYRIGIRHTFWGNSSLNKTNAPKRMMQFGYDNLDLAVVGHVHKAAGEMFTERGAERIAITGGTYKLDDHFGKKWGHTPEPPGYTVLLYPYQKKMQLCRTPEFASDTIINAIRNREEDGYIDPYTDMIRRLNLLREQTYLKEERERSDGEAH